MNTPSFSCKIEMEFFDLDLCLHCEKHILSEYPIGFCSKKCENSEAEKSNDSPDIFTPLLFRRSPSRVITIIPESLRQAGSRRRSSESSGSSFNSLDSLTSR